MTVPGERDAPPDAAARARALDPARSFIVEAPAGSGKTTLLTQRFLTLLARSQDPEAVLAITFTRKAAGEMRERIAAALDRAARGEQGKDSVDSETLRLATDVLAADAEHGWEVSQQPTRLRIQTIDSLNRWLAARLPILSRAGASLAVSPRPEELYARAARRTIAEIDAGGTLADSLAIVLEHLDNEVDLLEPLLATMLAFRDRWLRLVLPSGAPPDAALRAALEDALGALVAASLDRAAALLPADIAARVWPLARAAAVRLGPVEPGLGMLATAAAGPRPFRPEPALLPAWQALARLLLTREGRLRKSINKQQGFPPEARPDKAAFQALLAELAGLPELEAAFAEVARLPTPRYDAAQWRALVALHEVLLAAAARLGAVFAEEGAVDFSAVQQSALEALGSPEEPSDLTLALDYRLQHILVDEFQDTSVAQVMLLERLTGGWQPGDGRTLFLVGDPMQSIFGFREADVGLFLRIRQQGLGGVPLEPLSLVANFRSRPALVDWVNAAFRAVLPAREDLARGAVRYSPSRAVRDADNASGVELCILEDAQPADEAARVAAIVAAERARNPEASIAVLGRARQPLSAVARELRERRTAFEGVDLVPLADRLAVRDLISLTRALAHLADRVAWLACLRAPWCGLGLESLWELAGDAPTSTIWQLMHDEERLARLGPNPRARLFGTRQVLDAALADRGRRSLAACVEAAWVALGGPATLAAAADLDNAASFFACLDELETAGDLEDPARIDAALADLYAAPEAGADHALQLLTVHRAKGLEWDVVVLTGLGRLTRGSQPRLLRWLEFARTDRGPGLVLAPHRARAQDFEPLEAWLKVLERERAEFELGRLLYVAATRARERLYLVGHVHPSADAEQQIRAPARGSLLATLWPAVGPQVRAGREKVVAPTASTRPAGGRAPRLVRLADGWTAPPPAPGLVALADPPLPPGPSEFEFEWVTAAARHVGTVVHEELERAAFVAPAALAGDVAGRRDLWRQRLLELGVGDEQLPEAVDRVQRALEATFADPRGRWLFDPSHRDAASELDLSSVRAGQVVAARIDRTFVDPAGVRWIVDFKTSVHEGTDLEAFLDQERRRYEPQLESYARLMSARDPARPIRLGLYFPLHSGWREWAATGTASG